MGSGDHRRPQFGLAVAVFGAPLANSATFVSGTQISFIAASILLATAMMGVPIRSAH